PDSAPPSLHDALPIYPRFASRAEVTEQILATEREIARAQATAAGKPPQVVERIAEGKVEKFYQETVLTEQPFVKDAEKTVGQVIDRKSTRLNSSHEWS